MKNDGKEGYTGSPGENSCNASGCHTGFTINDPSGSITIFAPTLTNWQYIPGTVYPIQVTVTRSANSKFGFGFEALQASGANGGTLSITNATQTQLKTAVVSGNARTNVVHRNNGGLSAGSHTFTFNWTAPLSNIGNVTFYAAGNAANGLNNTAGDYIFKTSQVVTPTAVGLNEPSNLVTDFTLFPNPVSENFQVKFTMQKNASAAILLTNLLGETVQIFHNQNFHQGNHSFKLNLNEGVENGIYLLQISSENRIDSKKVVVIR